LSKGGTYEVTCLSISEAYQDLWTALYRNGFQLIEESRLGEEIVIRALRGSRFYALLHFFVPFASWIKELQRSGCEARFWTVGDKVMALVYVVPYMELQNRKEMFQFTQDSFEWHVDESLCEELWGRIFDNLSLKWKLDRFYGATLEPELTPRDEAREYSDSCPPRYNAKYCPYCRYCLPKQDRKYCTRHDIFL
jgi:hypothetical protein